MIGGGEAGDFGHQPFDDSAVDAVAGAGADSGAALKSVHSLAPVRSRAAT